MAFKKISITKEKAEQTIMDFQDLLMRCIVNEGLDEYNAEKIKGFAIIKDMVKRKVETSLNYKPPKGGEVPNKSSYVMLDLTSDKKYSV